MVVCTLDMATSIDMITRITQYTRRTVEIVDIVEAPQEDAVMAKVVSITATITMMIRMGMECIIIHSTTNILVTKINTIEVVEINTIETTQMMVVERCTDDLKEATTNLSIKNSITINTVTKIQMTLTRFQWAVETIKCSNSKIKAII